MESRVSEAVSGPVARIPTPPLYGKSFEINCHYRRRYGMHNDELVIHRHTIHIHIVGDSRNLSPAFETAATSSGRDIQDMPGKIKGYLQPKREVILVTTAGAAAISVWRCAKSFLI